MGPELGLLVPIHTARPLPDRAARIEYHIHLPDSSTYIPTYLPTYLSVVRIHLSNLAANSGSRKPPAGRQPLSWLAAARELKCPLAHRQTLKGAHTTLTL
jgi:hypothetical protein